MARATQLLSTRVDVTRERQNQAVLESMNRRAKMQLRLQQTVEGLSVVAITYYLSSLVGYLAKGLRPRVSRSIPTSPPASASRSWPWPSPWAWAGSAAPSCARPTEAAAMARTVLLTLGRLPKGLEVARSFARAGWRVIVAEPFAWHLARVSRDVARSYRVAAPNADHARYLRDIGGKLHDPVAQSGLTLPDIAAVRAELRTAGDAAARHC